MKTQGRQAIGSKDGISLVEILAALNQIYGAVDELEFINENIELNTDQINLNTDELEAKLDEVKALITASNNILTSIDENTDNIESELATVNLNLVNVIATLDSIDGKVATEATLLDIRNDVSSILTEIQSLNNRPELADNCSVSNIGASLTEVTLIAANTLRREVVIHNNSNGILYVICGGGATATNYNWRLRRGDHLTVDSFRGDLKGIFTNATGFAMVTEHFYT